MSGDDNWSEEQECYDEIKKLEKEIRVIIEEKRSGKLEHSESIDDELQKKQQELKDMVGVFDRLTSIRVRKAKSILKNLNTEIREISGIGKKKKIIPLLKRRFPRKDDERYLGELCRNYRYGCCVPDCQFLHMNEKAFNRFIRKPYSFEECDRAVKNYDYENRLLFQDKKIVGNEYRGTISAPLIKAAFILPFTFDEEGDVIVLFGYEIFNKYTNRRFRSFGGMRSVFRDKDCVDTCIRETVEETYGKLTKEYLVERFSKEWKEPYGVTNLYSFRGKCQMFLLKIDYIHPKEFIDQMKTNPHRYHIEKNDFVWVKWSKISSVIERKEKVVGVEGKEDYIDGSIEFVSIFDKIVKELEMKQKKQKK